MSIGTEYCYGEPGRFPSSEFRADASGDLIHTRQPEHYRSNGITVIPGPARPGVLRIRYAAAWSVEARPEATPGVMSIRDPEGQIVEIRFPDAAPWRLTPGQVEIAVVRALDSSQQPVVTIGYPDAEGHQVQPGRLRLAKRAEGTDDPERVVEIDFLGVWRPDFRAGRVILTMDEPRDLEPGVLGSTPGPPPG